MAAASSARAADDNCDLTRYGTNSSLPLVLRLSVSAWGLAVRQWIFATNLDSELPLRDPIEKLRRAGAQQLACACDLRRSRSRY